MCFSDLVFLTLPHWESHAVLVSSVAPCWPAPCPNHWTAAEPGRSSSSSAHAVTRTWRKWPHPGVETWRAARWPFSPLRRSGTRWWEAPASAPRPRHSWTFCLERTEAHQRSGWFSGGWKTTSAWARFPTRKRSLFLWVRRNSLYPTNRQLSSRRQKDAGNEHQDQNGQTGHRRPSGKFDEGTADPSCDISSQIRTNNMILMFA